MKRGDTCEKCLGFLGFRLCSVHRHSHKVVFTHEASPQRLLYQRLGPWLQCYFGMFWKLWELGSCWRKEVTGQVSRLCRGTGPLFSLSSPFPFPPLLPAFYLCLHVCCSTIPVLPGRLKSLKPRARIQLSSFQVFLLGILSQKGGNESTDGNSL